MTRPLFGSVAPAWGASPVAVVGRLWVPSDLGAKLRLFWVAGDAASQSLSASASTEYLAAVVSVTDTAAARAIVGSSGTGGRLFRIQSTEVLAVLRQNQAQQALSTNVLPISGDVLVGTRIDLSAPNTVFWINGQTESIVTGATPFAGSMTSVVGGPDTFAGVQALISTDLLTVAEREKVEGFLAWNYGSGNLPPSHPYYAAAPRVSTYTRPAFDLFLSVGQSNGRGQGVGYDAGLDATLIAGVNQYDRASGSIVSAYNPMRDWDPQASRTGHTYEFARLWKQETGRDCVIIPHCEGNTQLVGGVWASPSGARYLTALAEADAVVDAYPQATLRGILWDQGESDGIAAVSAANYKSALTSVISGFRAGISGASAVPFVITGMPPDWTALSPGGLVIDGALRDMPGLVSNCYFVDPVGLASNANPDEIHLGAAAQRTIAARHITTFEAIYPELFA